jgi:hypothetical protein
MVIAADRDQAIEVVFAYIEAFFDHVPMLAALVESRGKDSITLSNGIMIKVQTASFRRIRGRLVVAAVLDEIAYWYNEDASRNPDSEILKALRPSMVNVPNALLMIISSPYAMRLRADSVPGHDRPSAAEVTAGRRDSRRVVSAPRGACTARERRPPTRRRHHCP